MPISDYLKNLRTHVGTELLLVPSVSALFYDDRGRILLARHAEGNLWATPGGSVDPNESPADAVVREVWEETSLLAEPVRILGVYGGPDFEVTYPNGDRVTYLMTVFECRIVGGEMRPDGVEILELAYVAQSDLAGLDLSPWALKVLPDFFRDRHRAHFQPAGWRPPE